MILFWNHVKNRLLSEIYWSYFKNQYCFLTAKNYKRTIMKHRKRGVFGVSIKRGRGVGLHSDVCRKIYVIRGGLHTTLIFWWVYLAQYPLDKTSWINKMNLLTFVYDRPF